MSDVIKVGAAQIAPVFFDKKATLEKTLHYIEEGGRLGIDLLVFPEVYFCGYPYWRGGVSVKQSTELAAEMICSAIRWDGEEAQAMAHAACKAHVNCVVGCSELSDQPGSMTIYNSLIVISRQGEIVGRDRKLIPTHTERAYWGAGDASDIRVFNLDIGTVGCSICYEHHMTLLRAAMAIKGEEIHCALWPGWWTVGSHFGDKAGKYTPGRCDIESAIRQHAVENGVFLVSSSWYLRPEDLPAQLKDVIKFNLAIGGSSIINPFGIIIKGPVFEPETIVYSEIDLSQRRLAKAYVDGVGHYSRPDLLSLNIRDEAWSLTGAKKLDAAKNEEKLAALLKKYKVSVEELEEMLKGRGGED